jgi:AmiR/NasT family two-component response regulator
LNTPLESATRDQIAAAIAEIISAAVAEIAENRAVIDQAKGMLILLYGVDDQTAFDTLRRHSQNTNIELRALAEQLVSNYRALSNREAHSRPAWCTAKR